MSLFTQTDLDNVRQAYLDLITGSRVVQVTLNGKMTEFAKVNLSDLKTVLAEIEKSVSGKSRSYIVSTSKGFN